MESEVYRHAIELGQTPFSEAPERFDPVDVAMAVTGKFAVAVVDPKVACVTHVHQAVLAPPAITVNNAFN